MQPESAHFFATLLRIDPVVLWLLGGMWFGVITAICLVISVITQIYRETKEDERERRNAPCKTDKLIGLPLQPLSKDFLSLRNAHKVVNLAFKPARLVRRLFGKDAEKLCHKRSLEGIGSAAPSVVVHVRDNLPDSFLGNVIHTPRIAKQAVDCKTAAPSSGPSRRT